MVSVIVLTRNRPAVLQATLREIVRAIDDETEVIVVDNHSDRPVTIGDHADRVRLIRTDENRGVGGWNAGMTIARGDHFLLLDDDAYPDAGVLGGIRRRFEANPGIGAIALRIVHPETGSSENGLRFQRLLTRDDRDFLFIGCGVALRKEVFQTVGGFSESLFIYWHEMEYGVRLLDAGFSIQVAPELTVFHLRSDQERLTKTRVLYEVRNMLWIARKYFRSLRSWRMFIRHTGHFGILAARQNLIGPYLRGIVQGLGRNKLGRPTPISPEVESFITDRWSLTGK